MECLAFATIYDFLDEPQLLHDNFGFACPNFLQPKSDFLSMGMHKQSALLKMQKDIYGNLSDKVSHQKRREDTNNRSSVSCVHTGLSDVRIWHCAGSEGETFRRVLLLCFFRHWSLLERERASRSRIWSSTSCCPTCGGPLRFVYCALS